MLSRYISRLFGYGSDPRMDKWRAKQAADAAAHPYAGAIVDHESDPSKPYSGRPVPKESLLEGVKPNGGFLDYWHEEETAVNDL